MIWTLLVMLSTNCPKYDNMQACLAMFNQIPNYYHDYRGFRQAISAKQGASGS